MKLILTDHLKSRLELRSIPIKSVEDIFKKAKEFYWDNLRQHHVVIAKIIHQGRSRKMLAAYDIIENGIEVITTHTITNAEIKQSLISGRWIYEENKN